MKPLLLATLTTWLAVSGLAHAEDESVLTDTDRSILQAREEAAVIAGGFSEADHMTGNWGGLRERLFDSGIEVFAFWNSIISGNVAGGRDSNNATFVQDAWLGVKFDLEKLVGWKGGQFVVSG